MNTYDLKTEPNEFNAVLSGRMRFQFRYGDRNFALGDLICLREWIDAAQRYTGRTSTHEITCIVTCLNYDTRIDARWLVLGISEPKT
jgi:hypothetical protein